MDKESTEEQIVIQEYKEKRNELQRHTDHQGQRKAQNPAGVLGFFMPKIYDLNN